MVAVIFWILAATSVASAVAVVTLKSVFHAALMLVISFSAIAGLYIILDADFLAAVQILIYVGAVSVLLIFGLMLTSNARRGSQDNRLRFPTIGLLSALLTILLVAILGISWPGDGSEVYLPSVSVLAEALFTRYVLAFEVASVLLLAAILGAIVLVRER